MLLNEKKIAVDSSKYATKFAMNTASGVKKGSFRTKVSPWAEENAAPPDSHVVRFEGKTWIVGEAADDGSTSYDTSKKSDLHRIATYAAIALLTDNNDGVVLGIGCPPRVYYNETDREAYRNYIASEAKMIDICVDGVNRHFIIRMSFVFPESSGVIALEPARYMTSTIGVIDIGGLNVNAIVYKRMHPVIETYISEEGGGNVLRENVRRAFQERFSVQLTDYIMDDILRDGYAGSRFPKEEQRTIVREHKKSHVERVYNACQKAHWPLDFMDIRLCGGASVYLREEFKEVFHVGDDVFVDEANFVNVLGFLNRL